MSEFDFDIDAELAEAALPSAAEQAYMRHVLGGGDPQDTSYRTASTSATPVVTDWNAEIAKAEAEGPEAELALRQRIIDASKPPYEPIAAGHWSREVRNQAEAILVEKRRAKAETEATKEIDTEIDQATTTARRKSKSNVDDNVSASWGVVERLVGNRSKAIASRTADIVAEKQRAYANSQAGMLPLAQQNAPQLISEAREAYEAARAARPGLTISEWARQQKGK
jgi:hypothetical protein